METERSQGQSAVGEVFVGLEFHKVIDFDKKALRKLMRAGARQVITEARRIVSRRVLSAVGEFPGMVTGALKRAIGIISKGSKGGWIKVGVKKTAAMKDYYPAFLFYGSAKTGLKPRGNYIVTALDHKRETVRSVIRQGLQGALVPR